MKILDTLVLFCINVMDTSVKNKSLLTIMIWRRENYFMGNWRERKNLIKLNNLVGHCCANKQNVTDKDQMLEITEI